MDTPQNDDVNVANYVDDDVVVDGAVDVDPKRCR